MSYGKGYGINVERLFNVFAYGHFDDQSKNHQQASLNSFRPYVKKHEEFL